jgi:hypothetical protein
MGKRGWGIVAAALLAGGCASPGVPPRGGTVAIVAGLRAAELAFAGAAAAAEAAVDQDLLAGAEAERIALHVQRGHAALLLARAAAAATGQVDADAAALAAANDAVAVRLAAKLAVAAGE